MKAGIVVLFSLIIFSGCDYQNSHAQSLDVLSDYEGVIPQVVHTLVELPTMQCKACIRIIESGLYRNPGILSTHIDLKNKVVHINYDAESTSLDEIEQRISKLGYQANYVLADSVGYSRIPECCRVKI